MGQEPGNHPGRGRHRILLLLPVRDDWRAEPLPALQADRPGQRRSWCFGHANRGKGGRSMVGPQRSLRDQRGCLAGSRFPCTIISAYRSGSNIPRTRMQATTWHRTTSPTSFRHLPLPRYRSWSQTTSPYQRRSNWQRRTFLKAGNSMSGHRQGNTPLERRQRNKVYPETR